MGGEGRRTERLADREGTRRKQRAWEYEGEWRGDGDGLGKTLHYNPLRLQLCYLHKNNGGPASVEHLLINGRTGGKKKQSWEVGVEVLSLPRPSTTLSPVWTKWYFTLAKSIPSFQPQKSQLCLSPAILI